MKLKHIFAAALGLLMITACSDDNTIGTSPFPRRAAMPR